jgi:hypothetical protein
VRHHLASQFRPDSILGLPTCSVRKGKTTTRIEPLQTSERPLFLPSLSLAQIKLRTWMDEPQGPSLFGPFAGSGPQARDGSSTTFGKHSCKTAQPPSSQHIAFPSRVEDLPKEAVAATHRALFLDSFKSASAATPSRNTTETEIQALDTPKPVMADKRETECASPRGAFYPWPTCVTRATADKTHGGCVHKDYINLDRAYPPSPKRMVCNLSFRAYEHVNLAIRLAGTSHRGRSPQSLLVLNIPCQQFLILETITYGPTLP